MSTKVIMFANQKGGVGKTTSVFEISNILAKKGREVLMIDLDAQCNLTECSGVQPKRSQSIYDTIMGSSSFENAIIKVKDHLDILPGHRKMLSQYFVGADDVTALKEAREYIENYKKYNYIIIDVGPEAGQLMTMAMLASDYVVAVTTLSKLAYSGVVQMCADLIKGREHYKDFQVKPLGILLNNVKKITVADVNKEKFEDLKSEFGAEIFSTEIKSSCVLDECKEFFQSLNDYKPSHPIAKAFVALTDEIEERITESEGR
ncbi:MAG: ParA family protein [Lachnospiraceae bacterium]|nr:ParA family protein [Lachnospiraceae bacterium]